jgi:hypothetical protein
LLSCRGLFDLFDGFKDQWIIQITEFLQLEHINDVFDHFFVVLETVVDGLLEISIDALIIRAYYADSTCFSTEGVRGTAYSLDGDV